MTKVAIALLLLAGAIASRILLAHAPVQFSLDLAQPLPVATWWGGYGAQLFALLCIVLALGYVAYLSLLRRQPPPLRVTLIIAAASLAAGLAWSPLFSSDVYAYAAYGSLALHGVNPYAHAVLPGDPYAAAAQWQWTHALPLCVYGEAFVAIASALVSLTKALGVAATLDAFRVLSCAAFMLCAYLLANAGHAQDGERGRRAALFFALNPVALWSAAEGHNDTLMLAVVLGGFVLMRAQPVIGTALSVAAGTIKLPGLVPGAVFAALQWRARTWQPILGAVAGSIVVALASLPMVYAFTARSSQHSYHAFASVQSLHPLVAMALALWLALGIRRAATPIDRFCLLALIAWLAIPNPYPWYTLWVLPLAAWATDRRIALASLCVTATSVLRYIPDAVGTPGALATAALGLAALCGYAPLLRRAIISAL